MVKNSTFVFVILYLELIIDDLIMLIKTHAIVLRTIKYGDQKVIVDMFTEHIGCVTFIQRIQKTKRGRIGMQFFQPFTNLEIEYDARQNVALQKLKNIRIAYPFSSIPFSPYKTSISLFICEFLFYCVRSEQRGLPLYHFIEKSVKWLDASTHHFSNFHIVFMLRLTRFIGFYPNLEYYQDNDFFDLRNGEFTSLPPNHGAYIVPAEAAKINLLMRMNYSTMHVFRFSHEERNRCVDLILTYYRLHVPSFPELKSLSVLQTLYK